MWSERMGPLARTILFSMLTGANIIILNKFHERLPTLFVIIKDIWAKALPKPCYQLEVCLARPRKKVCCFHYFLQDVVADIILLTTQLK